MSRWLCWLVLCLLGPLAWGADDMTGMRTVCFGRFLIDVPQEAVVSGQSYEYMFGEIRSERLGGGPALFEQRMAEREAKLRAGKHEEEFSLVESRRPFPHARVFKLNKPLITLTTFGFEAYRLDKGMLYSMSETAFNEKKIDSVLARLETKLLPKLRYRLPEEIPTEPGFCLEEGFIADAGDEFHYERAGISFRIPRWPDVLITVYARTNGEKLDPPLLSRISKPFPAALAWAASHIGMLRKGERMVGPFAGQEVLETLPTGQGYSTHHFVWEALGEPRSIWRPQIHLEFATGDARKVDKWARHVPPSLTDEQAIRLFDAIVNSIRLRPTGPGKGAAATPPPRLPLGTRVTSCALCPESGLWQCLNEDVSLNPRRRFIPRGAPMPYGLASRPAPGLRGAIGRHGRHPRRGHLAAGGLRGRSPARLSREWPGASCNHHACIITRCHRQWPPRTRRPWTSPPCLRTLPVLSSITAGCSACVPPAGRRGLVEAVLTRLTGKGASL